MMTTIQCRLLADAERVSHTSDLFGPAFPFRLEPTIYNMAGMLASSYQGGYWEFYALSNGGFYMAPKTQDKFAVCCENGYEGTLSAKALGIAACLYAYSHLSFGGGGFGEACAGQYHLLRDWAMDHPEARAILAATD